MNLLFEIHLTNNINIKTEWMYKENNKVFIFIIKFLSNCDGRVLRGSKYVKRSKSTEPAHPFFQNEKLDVAWKKGASNSARISPFIWRYVAIIYRGLLE